MVLQMLLPNFTSHQHSQDKDATCTIKKHPAFVANISTLSRRVLYVFFPLVNKLKEVAVFQTKTTTSIKISPMISIDFLGDKATGNQMAIVAIAAGDRILKCLSPRTGNPMCLIAAAKITTMGCAAISSLTP